MNKPVIVFDGDDTLWLVEHLYDEARDLAREAVERADLDGAAWEAAERRIDVDNVARFGVAATRFPTSCVEAIDVVADGLGEEPLRRLRRDVREAAGTVFARTAPVIDGAADVLADLHGRHRLVLLTKGDLRVQETRVEDSRLGHYFDEVMIVAAKGPEDFRAALGGAPAAEAWSVGNSIPSDINPALEVGMSAVWIDAHVWEHERREAHEHHPRLHVAESLRDVPRLVRAHAAAGR